MEVSGGQRLVLGIHICSCSIFFSPLIKGGVPRLGLGIDWSLLLAGLKSISGLRKRSRFLTLHGAIFEMKETCDVYPGSILFYGHLPNSGVGHQLTSASTELCIKKKTAQNYQKSTIWIWPNSQYILLHVEKLYLEVNIYVMQERNKWSLRQRHRSPCYKMLYHQYDYEAVI